MDLGRRRLVVGAAAAVAGGAALGVARVLGEPDPVEVRAATVTDRGLSDRVTVAGSWPTTTTTTTLPNLDPTTGLGVSGPIGPPWPLEFTVGDAIVPEIALYQSPGVPVPTGRTIPNPTVEGYKLVVLVRDQQPDWLQVQINQRPNGATCWIKASDVALRTVPNHILIERGAKRLSVYHGDEQLMSTAVAPGRDSSPTPLGAFYVDILTRPSNPNGPYGPFQVSVTGFSEVYESFGGGNGQIAVHGTNRPELIGTPASHGCVRMTNEDITALIPLARQGTPVVIVA
ncbi:MAG: L,D-transpeptidase [Acidimicrobiales bacterium]|nr:L,D-transpeptidase [Acidimicrobiales bacterium]HRW36657.1 L,D-transpeptidase [Aquihabitans sp.]